VSKELVGSATVSLAAIGTFLLAFQSPAAPPLYVQVEYKPPTDGTTFAVLNDDRLQLPGVTLTAINLDAPGGLNVLRDGQFPGPDNPAQNVFPSNANANPASLLIDLGGPYLIDRITTYSRHVDLADAVTQGKRAPQVFTLLGSDDGVAFEILANVDTRPSNWTTKPGGGGQYRVDMVDTSLAPLPSTHARYLRFEMQHTISGDASSGTYYGEIDVVGFAVPEPAVAPLLLIAAAVTLRRARAPRDGLPA
jgi:hypothetical protein